MVSLNPPTASNAVRRIKMEDGTIGASWMK
jgi:hypothetical protein